MYKEKFTVYTNTMEMKRTWGILMEDHIPLMPDRSLLLGRQTTIWPSKDVVFHENTYTPHLKILNNIDASWSTDHNFRERHIFSYKKAYFAPTFVTCWFPALPLHDVHDPDCCCLHPLLLTIVETPITRSMDLLNESPMVVLFIL